LQQIPTTQNGRAYDAQLVDALRYIGVIIPQNESLASSEIYPQVNYFTDHKTEAPWVKTEKALIQFMWKNNLTYLLVPDDSSEPPQYEPTPLLVQLAQKPFEKISELYDEYTSVPRSDNNTRLSIDRSIRGEQFGKLFEKILDYNTESGVLHLYHLRSNITRDNLSIVTDKTRPILSVSLPINGTIMESEFGVLRVNVTGSAKDAESNINKVEISIDGSPFQLANPRALGDWSTWSFSEFVTEGTKRIMVRATDNAYNQVRVPVYTTIR
jgi:Bacterial Ig domain